MAGLERWMTGKGWKPYPFQRDCWKAVRDGQHGILNAPTGSGKTYALFLGALLRAESREQKGENGIRLLWVTPLRALAKDIANAMQQACAELEVDWEIGVRTGDTSQHQKKKQRLQPPDVLVITPESAHVLMSYKNGPELFRGIDVVVVDEWHELVGSKRGVQTELAIARIMSLSPNAVMWGISATIGNLDEAMQVLLGSRTDNAVIVKAKNRKKLKMTTLMPKHIERYPWTGHLGIRMLEDAEKVIRSSESTLVFTNTRSQAEIWYQQFLDQYPDYAGQMALHHGSLDADVRAWVESAIKDGRLRVVFCTSSLDLGVDFAPVDSVIQVGSPKGVARFLQRAGRSGHRPDATSRIAFLPTHALEIVEGAAMRTAIAEKVMEDRRPFYKPIDVLSQWLVTLACGDGFNAEELRDEVRQTHAFEDLTDEEWSWVLDFITRGGSSLTAYPEFRKVIKHGDVHVVADRRTSMRHRMQIGTIDSDAALHVQFIRGKRLGTIEESFIGRLEPGDVFWFAGRCLEFVEIREMTAYVVNAKSQKGAVPRWTGGRLPLSSQMSAMLRRTLHEAADGVFTTEEARRLRPLLELQIEGSALPHEDEFLIETFRSREGYHAFFYPFEGRLAHEGMAALFALRLSRLQPITFSMAMNDYGFELLSDKPIPLQEGMDKGLFAMHDLANDVLQSANVALMARRRFRNIARVAGLVFQGFPTKQKKARHLQASAELFFDVFKDYDPHNLLLKQALDETLQFELDEQRIREALERVRHQRVLIRELETPTPLAVPILVDRLREKVGSERTEDLLKKLLKRQNV